MTTGPCQIGLPYLSVNIFLWWRIESPSTASVPFLFHFDAQAALLTLLLQLLQSSLFLCKNDFAKDSRSSSSSLAFAARSCSAASYCLHAWPCALGFLRDCSSEPHRQQTRGIMSPGKHFLLLFHLGPQPPRNFDLASPLLFLSKLGSNTPGHALATCGSSCKMAAQQFLHLYCANRPIQQCRREVHAAAFLELVYVVDLNDLILSPVLFSASV